MTYSDIPRTLPALPACPVSTGLDELVVDIQLVRCALVRSLLHTLLRDKLEHQLV